MMGDISAKTRQCFEFTVDIWRKMIVVGVNAR